MFLKIISFNHIELCSSGLSHRLLRIKAFVDKFGSEFRLASLSKLVLPIDSTGNPFVTAEGLLPAPCLSTLNALKILRGKSQADWHPAAKDEICSILEHGLQVEYVEFESFTAWQQYMEGAAARGLEKF